jgi:hypothetical protein
MAVTAHWYTKALANAFGGETEAESKKIDYLTDDIKCLLCTSSYTPNQNSHETIADITDEVAAGSGYSTGGILLTNKTIVVGTNVVYFDATDPSWADSSITARYAIIYSDEETLPADKLLLAYIDFGANKTSESNDFTVKFATNGFSQQTTN